MAAYASDVIEFTGRNTDETVYVYPHRYRIELRKTHHGWEQRHIWMWNDGRVEEESWIRSLDHSRPGALNGYREIQAAEAEAA